MTCSITELAAAIRDFRADARKRWATDGWNATLQLFHEELSPEGKSVDAGFFRFRVQSRQVFVFAQAYAETHNAAFRDLACTAWDTARRLYRVPSGGFINAVNREGRPHDAGFRTYEQAFAIFAAMWLYRITADPSYLDDAEAVWTFLDTRMRHAVIGFVESDTNRDPHLQNPHMHLFEALLHAYLFTADDHWLERAAPLYDLFTGHIVDKQRHVIAETFASQRDTTPPDAMSEPGHSGEWIWLSRLYEKCGGTSSVEIRHALYARLLEDGIDPINHFGYDGLASDGIGKQRSKRLWVQCEILKAHLAIYAEIRDEEALLRAGCLASGIIDTYLIPGGLWHEHLDECGNDLRHTIPATSLYHLDLAFAEALAIFHRVAPC